MLDRGKKEVKNMEAKQKYLVARPIFPGATGFCHRTTLIRARSARDAIAAVQHLYPNDNIGDVKPVDY